MTMFNWDLKLYLISDCNKIDSFSGILIVIDFRKYRHRTDINRSFVVIIITNIIM